jgi:SNF2 family DNA or RNA helicase
MVETDFERPITTAGKKNATAFEKEQGRIATRELEKITSTFMLRRLQVDILKSILPPRKEMMLFCRPSTIQSKLYKTIANSPGDDRLSTLMSLRKLCSYPTLVKENMMNDMYESSSSGKLHILERLLETIYHTNPTDKVVVVSNFTSALTVIEKTILTPKKWSSIRLDGTIEQSVRQTLVNSFNRGSRDSSFVFLLSSKAGGCGLNLIGANRLIMFDLGKCVYIKGSIYWCAAFTHNCTFYTYL